jgi:hypothetical protein
LYGCPSGTVTWWGLLIRGCSVGRGDVVLTHGTTLVRFQPPKLEVKMGTVFDRINERDRGRRKELRALAKAERRRTAWVWLIPAVILVIIIVYFHLG